MRITADLTRKPITPRVYTFEDDAMDPVWVLEIHPNYHDGSETIELWADSPDDLVALGEAIVAAVGKPRMPAASCRCGHSRASHQPDTGECWGFILDADSQYCRCSGYVDRNGEDG